MTDQKKNAKPAENSAKNIIVKPITAASAARMVRRLHYSGKVVNNSQIHFGVFWNDRCEGVLQFGPPMDKSKVLGLVKDTRWNGMIELNRMAFSPRLPRNSESRAIAVAMRLIKKANPHIEWVLSFADATQCGDGTIYRASGFVLTSIKPNRTIIRLADGSIVSSLTMTKGKHVMANRGKASIPEGAERIKGFQLRYIYFLNPAARQRLVPEPIPFSEIEKRGAAMYKGQARGKHLCDAPGFHPEEGGSSPTPPLQSKKRRAGK